MTRDHRTLFATAEIDSVYIVYNEFKSVIAQRLIVEQVLPIEEIGEPGVPQSEAMSEKDRGGRLRQRKKAE